MNKLKIENISAYPFTGWARGTTDVQLPHEAGHLTAENGDVARYQLGSKCGLDTNRIDVFVTLAAHEKRVYDLGSASPADFKVEPQLPDDPHKHFGGPVRIGDVDFKFVGMPKRDGASILSVMRCRFGRLFCATLWLRYYPDMPFLVHGELDITASNPSVPDLFDSMPDNFDLRFGDSVVYLPYTINRPVASGTTFADGQSRKTPVTFVFPRHLPGNLNNFHTAFAVTRHAISVIGIQKLLADGNPIYPTGFSARAWTKPKFEDAPIRLASWLPAVCGPNPNSGNTGAQEDQIFVRGEALLEDGGGAEIVAYMSALKMANRPCHHLEADGSQLSLAGHPNLRMWGMRPDKRLAPDLLGKMGGVADWDVPGGWWGADEEHLLYNTLAAACRLTGSYALQHELSAVARNYLYDHGPNGRSGPARAWGWEGFFVVHCWRELEDRGLAEAVAGRWHNRFHLAKEHLMNYDVRTDDPRLGPGRMVMGWQEAVKCGGWYHAGKHLGVAEACEMAAEHAKRLLDDGYVQASTGGWASRDVISLDNHPVGFGFYNFFGYPMASATVLMHEPGHEKARSIWSWLKDNAKETKQTAWLMPGIS